MLSQHIRIEKRGPPFRCGQTYFTSQVVPALYSLWLEEGMLLIFRDPDALPSTHPQCSRYV